MEPHSSFGAILMLSMKQQISIAAMAQALIVAGVTAAVTSFATVKVLEREMLYVRETLNRQEMEEHRIRDRLEAVQSKQDAAVSQAYVIHDNLDRRLQVLESQRHK